MYAMRTRWWLLAALILSAGCTSVLPNLTPTATPPAALTAAPPGPTATFGPIIGVPAATTAATEPAAATTLPGGSPVPRPSFGPVIRGEAWSPTPLSSPASQRFVLRDDAIDFRPHPDGCSILAVAGQVLDAQGVQLPGRHRVHVWGDNIDLSATAGSDPRWGPAGYEIVLADQPREMALNIQLLEVTSGAAASEVFRVQTLPRCEANHLIADFAPAPN
jgi:hypothetical protein